MRQRVNDSPHGSNWRPRLGEGRSAEGCCQNHGDSERASAEGHMMSVATSGIAPELQRRPGEFTKQFYDRRRAPPAHWGGYTDETRPSVSRKASRAVPAVSTDN